jgi:hypothetical protein
MKSIPKRFFFVFGLAGLLSLPVVSHGQSCNKLDSFTYTCTEKDKQGNITCSQKVKYYKCTSLEQTDIRCSFSQDTLTCCSGYIFSDATGGPCPKQDEGGDIGVPLSLLPHDHPAPANPLIRIYVPTCEGGYVPAATRPADALPSQGQ